MIHVAIADDHPLVREGIKKVLNNEIDIKVTAEASEGGELMDLLKAAIPDIVIMDITMPGKSGLDLLKDIHALYPRLPVLILSIHPAERYAVRAIKAGAQGYLSKASISDELVQAVKKITNGKRRYITPEVAEQLALQMDSDGQPLYQTLSDREFEVLCLIASGKDVNCIAAKLSLSSNTVHTYRSRIKEKMNLTSNVEMTRYAIENGLLN